MFKFRDWGWWLVLWKGKHFKLKLIYFKKNKKLSYQRHEYRYELWLFLMGAGNMRNAGTLQRGDFAMIEKNAWHQFIAGNRTLVLEVQFGEKCNEEDIERKE